jgi:hypothetical protein
VAYPLHVRHLHPEWGRRMTLRATELLPLAFRPQAWPAKSARQAPVPLRAAARTARVLRQAAVTLRAAVGSCRDRDAQRGPPRGAF